MAPISRASEQYKLKCPDYFNQDNKIGIKYVKVDNTTLTISGFTFRKMTFTAVGKRMESQ